MNIEENNLMHSHIVRNEINLRHIFLQNLIIVIFSSKDVVKAYQIYFLNQVYCMHSKVAKSMCVLCVFW